MKNILCTIIIISSLLQAQQSGTAYYKSAVMNGNNIRTVFGNWGVIGQPVDTRPRGTWPKESNGYIGDNSFMIGVEFPIRDFNNDGKPDTIHSVITTPVSRPASSFDTDDNSAGGKPWTFMPVEGFFNPAQTRVAMSNDPSTWPDSWTNSWKGLNGGNAMVADLESYFQMDDQNDLRFSAATNNPKGIAYHPDTLNILRKGAGVRVNVRYLQYNHPLFKDILFRVYDISNESSFDYPKVFFGYLSGTLVGVTGAELFNEYDDDYSILYKKENVVITGDFDESNVRNPFWRGAVGKIGEALLLSEGNETIASYQYFTPSNNIPLGDDEQLWQQFAQGRYVTPSSIINDTTVLHGADGDYIFGSQYCFLPSKSKKRIVSAIAYDYSSAGIFQKIKLGKVLTQKGFKLSDITSQLPLPAFSFVRTFSAAANIQWPTHNPSGTTEIYFSPDAGSKWITVGEGVQDNGSFAWNTTTIPDCAFGKIRIFFKDSAGRYNGVMESGKSIAVNNPGNGSPFVKILSGPSGTESITDAVLPLQVLIGDPDNKDLTVTISYSTGGPFVKHQMVTMVSDTVPQQIPVNVSEMPNGTNFKIRIEITDGALSWSDSTETFVKNTPRNIAAPSNVTVLSGSTQANITLGVVDKLKTTSDTYIVSFSDTAKLKPKTVSVFNKTKNITMLDRIELMRGVELPPFDGIRLSIDDPGTTLDTVYWNRNDSIPPMIVMAPLEILNTSNTMVYGYTNPKDYQIITGIKSITTDLAPFLGFSTPPESVNVSVMEKGTGKKIDFYFNRSSPSEALFVFVESVLGKNRITWMVNHHQELQSGTPRSGDTITIITRKGISINDSLQIKNVALGVEDRITVPEYYSLSQNYPNPFNPVTTIQYSVPNPGAVSIAIFDMLGREIKTVRRHHSQAGTFTVSVDASDLSSGMYFYHLSASGFSKVKKMIVLK